MDQYWNTGISQYGFNQNNLYNSYANQTMMNDWTGSDWDSSMNMDSSIWSMPGAMPGMAMPYGPSFGGQNMNQYYRNVEDQQNFMIESNVRQQQKMREADSKVNGVQRTLRQSANNLRDSIQSNNQELVRSNFDTLVENLRRYNGDDCTEIDLRNQALELYETATGGQTVQANLRQYGSDSLTQGFKDLIPFVTVKTSAEENIAHMTGQSESKTSSIQRGAGSAIGGAIIGLLGKTVYTFAKQGAKFGFKGGVAATIIGAVAGWALGQFNRSAA